MRTKLDELEFDKKFTSQFPRGYRREGFDALKVRIQSIRE